MDIHVKVKDSDVPFSLNSFSSFLSYTKVSTFNALFINNQRNNQQPGVVWSHVFQHMEGLE